VLVHLVDVSSATGRDPVTDLDTVRQELELFQPTLAAKPQIVAASKMDAVDDPSRVRVLEQRARELGLPFFRISGASGEGLPALLEATWQHLAAALPPPAPPVQEEVVPLSDARARARAPQEAPGGRRDARRRGGRGDSHGRPGDPGAPGQSPGTEAGGRAQEGGARAAGRKRRVAASGRE